MPVDGRQVYLEVTRYDDRAYGSRYRIGKRIGDAVRDAYRLDRKGAELESVASLDGT